MSEVKAMEMKFALDSPEFLVQLAKFEGEFKLIWFEREHGSAYVLLDNKAPGAGACATWLECLGFSKQKTEPDDDNISIYKAKMAA